MINSKVYFDDPSKETWITVERFDGNELKGMDSQLYYDKSKIFRRTG